MDDDVEVRVEKDGCPYYVDLGGGVSEAIRLLQSIEAKVYRLDRYLLLTTVECPECRGAGEYLRSWPPTECSYCAGSGRVPRGRGGEG